MAATLPPTIINFEYFNDLNHLQNIRVRIKINEIMATWHWKNFPEEGKQNGGNVAVLIPIIIVIK